MRKPVNEKLHEIFDLIPPGKVLEVGAFSDEKSSRRNVIDRGFEYTNLDISESDVPGTVIGDLCSEDPDSIPIDQNSMSLVICSDVFEHLQKPWIAAKNVASLIKPGGYAFIYTVWSWRYHPVPIDYWRFSDECLKFLFDELDCIEAGLDNSQRRKDIRGFYPDKSDYVEIDDLGGWRENWGSYFIGKRSL